MSSSTRCRYCYDRVFVYFLLIGLLLVLVLNAAQSLGLGPGFHMQDVLIGGINRLRLKLGDRVFNNVLIGKNGWMHYTGEQNLDDYQNAIYFSPERLQSMVDAIESCYRFADEHNFTFLIVVAPNKASIYPDTVPDQIRPLAGSSRLDKLNMYLRLQSLPDVLDLRLALIEARQQRDVYYKTDTHWNGYGAYIAYEEIISRLSQDHPALIAYPENFFRFREDSAPNGLKDLARALHASRHIETSIFPTRNLDDFVYTIDFRDTYGYNSVSYVSNDDLPKLLMFHDSFGNAYLKYLLSTNFNVSHFMHRSAVGQYLNDRSVALFSPDIVLYEIAERRLFDIQTDFLGCAP